MTEDISFRELLHFYHTFDVHKHEFSDDALEKVKKIVQYIYLVERRKKPIPTHFDELYVRMYLYQYNGNEDKIIRRYLKLSTFNKEGASRIVKCYKDKSATLDLSGLKVCKLPPCITELTWLKSIKL